MLNFSAYNYYNGSVLVNRRLVGAENLKSDYLIFEIAFGVSSATEKADMRRRPCASEPREARREAGVAIEKKGVGSLDQGFGRV